MKKFVSRVLAVVVFAVTMFLASCSSENIFGDSSSCHWVHIVQNDLCFKVKDWKVNGERIQVETEEYGEILFSSGTYILVLNESECPICAKLEGI